MADPGWYPDPSNGAQLRWWNGVQWTTVHAQAGSSSVSLLPPPPLPPPPRPGSVPPPLQADLASTIQTGRQAATWLWLAAAMSAVALGFIVPIVNLWFPYVVARDCLPTGHAGRRSVGAWWALYLLYSVSGLVVLIGVLTSEIVGVTLALAGAGVGFMAVVKARDMIRSISDCHTDLVGRSTTSGDPGAATWQTW